MRKCVVFAGGGSGGHVTPNIALIRQLSSICNCEIHYIGTDSIEKRLISQLDGVVFHTVTAKKLVRSLSPRAFANNLCLPFALIDSVKQCKAIIKEINPDVAFVKGGYVCVPVTLACRKQNVPVLAHESDYSLGLTHKLFLTYSLDVKGSNSVTVGSPIRQEYLLADKQKGLQTTGFCGKKPILLVLGGSLGATSLNNAVKDSLPALTEKFDVFNICGKGKTDKTLSQLQGFHQCEYCDNIFDVYACATLALTRGGSNTLIELAVSNLPFCCVPLTRSSRGEQKQNADYFARHNACYVLNEADLTQQSLLQAVNNVYDNLKNYKRNLRYLDLDATGTITSEILKYLD